MYFIFIIIIGIFLLYIFFDLYFLGGLFRLNRQPSFFSTVEPTVSVIIAARNEEKNLSKLLEDLTYQTYSKNNLEIIISDDRSSDSTWKIIEHFQNKHSNIIGIKIERASNEMTPKKHALTQAINQSNGEIIISTDADCRVPTNWVNNIVKQFDKETGIVVGYSKINIEKPSFFNEYQNIDFLALMAANSGSLGWGIPWTGSGQNIAYRRSAFDKIDGFRPVADQLSGDDFYLVQAISKIAKARFNPNPDGFVKTQPVKTVLAFFQQRTRWASNTQKLFDSYSFFLLFLFLNLFVNTTLFLGLFIQGFWFYLPIFFGIKLLVDSFLIFYGSKIYKTPVKIIVYLIWSIFQIIYTPILAVSSMIGKFRWKE